MGRATAKQKARQGGGGQVSDTRRGTGVTVRGAVRQPGGRRGAETRASAAERKAGLRARSGVPRKGVEAAIVTEYPIGKSRKSLKGIAIYMHPLAKDVLTRIAREQGRSVQELGLEALNLLFRHYGERPIA